MTNYDISRHVLQPAKQYSGARMQKGRVLLDSDFNEGEMLDDEGQRVVVVDVVGRHGSADLGFSINIKAEEPYDFDILAGSYYLGGMRHELEGGATGAQLQRFTRQSDWRQSNRVSEVPAPPTPPTSAEGERHDLVYLVGWEQPVSACEDGELLEHALGGLDTSTRMRRMHRVYVKKDVVDSCTTAFNALVTELTVDGHAYDAATGELRSGARLKVGLDANLLPEDLCSPAGTSGYRGAENQAIRVQLIGTTAFLWSFDDAGPLYRVTVSETGGVVKVVFRTPPHQQSQFPLTGQILEILPWGADLPNKEHVADHQIAANIGGGVLARVTVSYNPRTKLLEADNVDTVELGKMLQWFVTEDIPEAERFFFLRVWNPDGNPGTTYGTPFDVLPAPVPVALPGTGLTLEFSQAGIIGDHWVIAARPSTPKVVVPWELATAAAPHGPRRFYCPLALVHWSFDGTVRQVHAHSCRSRFRPLTRLGGCCNVTVGDGATSHGDYTSIQAAILALAPDRPGKVCVLPGVYEEIIEIKGRKDVVVEGCGERTILRTPAGNTVSQAIVTLEACERFTIRDLAVEASGQFGVGVRASATAFSSEITLERLTVTTRRDATLDRPTVGALGITAQAAAFPLCTIAAVGVVGLKVVGCKLTMVGDLSAAANVLLAACVRAVVRDCEIVTPPGITVHSRAWGGLHIAGNCVDVVVERCEIREGLGYGITLGSVRPPGGLLLTASVVPTNEDGIDDGGDCPGLGGGLPYAAADNDTDPPVQYVPDPGPHGVTIRENRITGMGSSGISVLGFFAEGFGDAVQQIQTDRLEIADNIIENNYLHPSEVEMSDGLRAVVAFGGVVLAAADDLRIHDNMIRGNGVDHRFPVCGIYLLHGENVVVENNQIRGNGPRVAGSGFEGNRAGIALQLVGRRIVVDDGGGGGGGGVSVPSRDPLIIKPGSTLPAARVRGNVVLQPAGRALQIYGIGPMFIESNFLFSEGLDAVPPAQRRSAAHCIEIQNIGLSSEAIGYGGIPDNSGVLPVPPLFYTPGRFNAADPLMLDGRVLFTDNQVRFRPAVGTGTNVFCATRIQSYGDVAVLGNQFFAQVQPGEGFLLYDTIVTAWSTRTSHNRWEDPIYQIGASSGPIVTNVSAQTLAFLNITTHNQASRPIQVNVAALSAPIINNPIDRNVVWNSD